MVATSCGKVVDVARGSLSSTYILSALVPSVPWLEADEEGQVRTSLLSSRRVTWSSAGLNEVDGRLLVQGTLCAAATGVDEDSILSKFWESGDPSDVLQVGAGTEPLTKFTRC